MMPRPYIAQHNFFLAASKSKTYKVTSEKNNIVSMSKEKKEKTMCRSKEKHQKRKH